jgi:drug/metabolite transporter (DMT)-like permease
MSGAFLSGAAYSVVRKLRESDNALTVVLYFPILSIPLSIPLVWLDHVSPDLTEWAYLIGIGVSSQIGQVFMTMSYHSERAARASTASYVQILFAIVWGLLLFGENLDLWLLMGALLVVGGTAAVSLIRPLRSKPSQD